MFKVLVEYPSEEEEFEIIRRTTSAETVTLDRILSARDILNLQETVRRVPCAEHVARYAMQLTRSTRVNGSDVPDFVRNYVAWGAGPRASQNLVLAGKARALLRGRYFVSTEDIRSVAHPVLRHRILLNFNAEADGINTDGLIDRLIEEVPTDSSSSIDESLAGRVFAGEQPQA